MIATASGTLSNVHHSSRLLVINVDVAGVLMSHTPPKNKTADTYILSPMVCRLFWYSYTVVVFGLGRFGDVSTMVVAHVLYENKCGFEILQRLDYKGCVLTLNPKPQPAMPNTRAACVLVEGFVRPSLDFRCSISNPPTGNSLSCFW